MNRRHFDALVIGTGPGGAVTARALAEAGASVLVVEEGPWIRPGTYPQYSLEQMRRQYRGAGLTVALGRPSVAYAQGMGVGGGSEVSPGFYYRPSTDLLAKWAHEWGIEALSPADVWPHSDVVERELEVGPLPWSLPPASGALARAANVLGWRGMQIPRWARYDERGGHRVVERRSMSVTYWPQAVAAGAELRDTTRAVRLTFSGPRSVSADLEDVRTGRMSTVSFDHVFVCAGTVHTPALLQRSGLHRNIGDNLSVHPTVRAVAQFDDELNDPEDVSVYQVREFAPQLSFGGSASSPAQLALALSGNWPSFGDAMNRWEHLSLYYAATQSIGRGKVRAITGFREPLVRYRLTRVDFALISTALARLIHLLLAAGATEIYPSFRGAPTVSGPADAPAAVAAMTRSSASLMTVHLCGTVPMGEDATRCGANSFGRVHGTSNVFVNDASMLPSAPGINPQGTLMAVAARNIHHFLTTQ